MKACLFAVIILLFSTQGVYAMPIMPFSPTCPAGSNEAQKNFERALDYHKARKGMPYDLKKAEHYYKKAIEQGSTKAVLNLGVMNIHDYANKGNWAERHKYAVELFRYAIEQGCPDGYHFLSECSFEGWGMARSKAASERYMREGA